VPPRTWKRTRSNVRIGNVTVSGRPSAGMPLTSTVLPSLKVSVPAFASSGIERS
jgi:hypothetical protein